MANPKPKKIGRPKLPKGEAKGRIVPVRFATNTLKVMTKHSKDNQQSLSEWIREQAAVGAYPILERAMLCTIESGRSLPVSLKSIRYQMISQGGPLYNEPNQEEQVNVAISRLERDGRIRQEGSPGDTAPYYVRTYPS